jgi:hypothetical protein
VERCTCNPVDTDRQYRRAYCLHHQFHRLYPKRRSLSTRLHVETFLKTAIFVFISPCKTTFSTYALLLSYELQLQQSPITKVKHVIQFQVPTVAKLMIETTKTSETSVHGPHPKRQPSSCNM